MLGPWPLHLMDMMRSLDGSTLMTDLYIVSLNRNPTPACPCLLAPEKMILHPSSRSRTPWSFQRNSARPTTSHFNLCSSFTRRSLFPDPRRDLTFQVPMFTVVLALLNFRTSLTFRSAGTCFPIEAGFRHAASSADDLVCLGPGLRVGLFPILVVIHTLLARRGLEEVRGACLASHLACPFSYLVSSCFCSYSFTDNRMGVVHFSPIPQ